MQGDDNLQDSPPDDPLSEPLDVLLFDRSGHRARLTPAGRELMQEGRQLLRAAGELECRVKRVATGWETELRIALDIMIPAVQLFPLIADFYADNDDLVVYCKKFEEQDEG